MSPKKIVPGTCIYCGAPVERNLGSGTWYHVRATDARRCPGPHYMKSPVMRGA